MPLAGAPVQAAGALARAVRSEHQGLAVRHPAGPELRGAIVRHPGQRPPRQLLHPDVVTGVGGQADGQPLAVGRQGPAEVVADTGSSGRSSPDPPRVSRPLRSTHTMVYCLSSDWVEPSRSTRVPDWRRAPASGTCRSSTETLSMIGTGEPLSLREPRSNASRQQGAVLPDVDHVPGRDVLTLRRAGHDLVRLAGAEVVDPEVLLQRTGGGAADEEHSPGLGQRRGEEIRQRCPSGRPPPSRHRPRRGSARARLPAGGTRWCRRRARRARDCRRHRRSG